MLGTVYHAGKAVQKATVCAESHSSLVCSRGYAAAVYSVGMQHQLFLCVEASILKILNIPIEKLF